MTIDRAKKDEEIDVDEVLDELELKIDRLKVLYEQYFMGIEKMEPQTARKEVTRKLLELTQMNIRNTATRYRYNSLNQKFGVYTTYWNRVLREIEKGTYYRNVARAGRDAARRGVEISDEVMRALPERMRSRILKDREVAAARKKVVERAPAPAPADDVEALGGGPAVLPPDLFAEHAKPVAAPPPVSRGIFDQGDEADGGDDGFDEKFDELFDNLAIKTQPKPVPKPPPPPPPPPPPVAVKPPPLPRGPTLPPGVDEPTARELFKRYVQAKKVLGENTDALRYEQLVSTLSKQAPKIMEQHQAKAVDFEVVIKDNKVILKAKPKR